MTSHGADTTRHAGDELDCPACRVKLLEAFREPVSAPAAPRLRDWFTPARPVSEPGVHAVQVTVDETYTVRSGTWSVTCSCGWSKCGTVRRYGRPLEVIQEHLTLTAQLWAARHLNNPLEGTEDQ